MVRCTDVTPIKATGFGDVSGEVFDVVEEFAALQCIGTEHAKAIYYGAIMSNSVLDCPRAALVAVDVLKYAMRVLEWDGASPTDQPLTKERLYEYERVLLGRIAAREELAKRDAQKGSPEHER